MRRFTTVVVGLGMLTAACGGQTTSATAPTAAPTDAPTSTTTLAPATTTTTTVPAAPSTTADPGGAPEETTTTTTEAPRALPADAVAAPDFVFPLAEGGEFALRDAMKPIYLVFWAEW